MNVYLVVSWGAQFIFKGDVEIMKLKAGCHKKQVENQRSRDAVCTVAQYVSFS